MAVTLSVIIVTYNNQEHIRECLGSVGRQAQYIDTEVIVVDNNSRDETVRFIEKEGGYNYSLQLIRNETNRFFAPAVNQGLTEASGEYLFFLNPDTRLEPEALGLLLEYIRRDRQVGVVAPQLLNPDGSVQPSCRRFPKHRDVFFHFLGLHKMFPQSPFFNGWKMGDFDHQEIREVDQPQGAALMTSRVVLNKVGLLDESFPMFFNDVDWCRRVKERDYAIVYYPQARIIHFQGSSVRQVKSRMIVQSHVSFFRYFDKYCDSLPGQFLNLFVGLLLYTGIPVRVTINTFTGRE